MMSSKAPPMVDDDNKAFKCLGAKGGEKGKELSSVSARKLAATLWEISAVPQPGLKREEILDEKLSEVGGIVVRKEMVLEMGSKAVCLSDVFGSPVSEGMDPPKACSHRRRASVGSLKLLQADYNVGGAKSPNNCLVEVDQKQNYARSPCRHVFGSKNRLKDVYNGLVTSKELLKVMNRICHFEQQNSTSLSLFSALKFELDRAFIHVNKLILEQKANQSEIDILLKQFEEEKLVWKFKQQERIRSSLTSVAGELEIEKKLKRQTERLNKKLGKELLETKESLTRANKELESEKRAREILEQACDELARGIGEDRAEVEELKRQNDKVREEVEKEREMLQLADVLREERVQMKLSDAKYQFEEKNELVDKLRNELEAYLKSKRAKEEQADGSPSYDKIKELEKYLRETLPDPGLGSHQLYKSENILVVNKEDEDEDEDEDDNDEEDDDSGDDSDLHSIELNVDDASKSFQWIEAKRNSVDQSKGRKAILEKTQKTTILAETKLPDGIEWEFPDNKQEDLDVFNRREPLKFTSKSWKKDDVADELERYNMIKDLRDHIVSGSRMAKPSQDHLASPNQQNVAPKDPNGVVCLG